LCTKLVNYWDKKRNYQLKTPNFIHLHSYTTWRSKPLPNILVNVFVKKISTTSLNKVLHTYIGYRLSFSIFIKTFLTVVQTLVILRATIFYPLDASTIHSYDNLRSVSSSKDFNIKCVFENSCAWKYSSVTSLVSHNVHCCYSKL